MTELTNKPYGNSGGSAAATTNLPITQTELWLCLVMASMMPSTILYSSSGVVDVGTVVEENGVGLGCVGEADDGSACGLNARPERGRRC